MLEWLKDVWPAWLTPQWRDLWVLSVCVLIAWANASMDILRDSKNNIYTRWADRWEWFRKWFERSGNDANNPRSIFTADPWHAFKHIMLFLFGLSLSIATGRWFYLLTSIVIGILFTFFYHNWLRRWKNKAIDRDYRPFWQIVGDTFTFWSNPSARDKSYKEQ